MDTDTILRKLFEVTQVHKVSENFRPVLYRKTRQFWNRLSPSNAHYKLEHVDLDST